MSLFILVHFRQPSVAIADLSAVRSHKTDEVLQKHRLSRAACADDHIAFARLIFDIDSLQDLNAVKTLV